MRGFLVRITRGLIPWANSASEDAKTAFDDKTKEQIAMARQTVEFTNEIQRETQLSITHTSNVLKQLIEHAT